MWTALSIERRLVYALAALALASPFVTWHGARDFANLPQSAAIQIGVLALAIVALVLRLAAGTPLPRRNPVALPLLALVVWAAASVGWAYNAYEWLTAWLHWGACALLCVLTFHLVQTLSHARVVIAALFGAAVTVSAVGAAQHWFGHAWFGSSWFDQVAPPASTLANRNFAAQFLVCTWPLGVALLGLSAPRRWLTWGCALGIALVFAYLLYTGTRAAWLTAMVQLAALAIALAVWRNRLAGRSRLAPLAVPLAAAAALLAIAAHSSNRGIEWGANALTERAASIAPALSHLADTRPTPAPAHGPRKARSSVEVRQTIWQNTLAMIAEHPLLGVGAGNHKIFYPAYAHRVRADTTFGLDKELEHAHNDYLQLLAELGAVGLALCVVTGLVVVAMIARLSPRRLPPACGIVVLSLALSIAGVAINAAASSPLQKALPPMVLAICVGILGALYRRWRPLVVSSSPAHRPWMHRTALAVCLTLVTLTLALVSRLQYQELAASERYLAAGTADNRRDWNRVLLEGRRGLDHSPEQRKILLYVGAALLELGRAEAAMETFRQVLETYPYQLNARAGLAFALRLGDRDADALEAFRAVLALKPDLAPVHAEVAAIYAERGDLARTLESYRSAARHAPWHAEFHYSHGIVAQRAGHPEEAAGALQRAVALAPASAVAHRALGVVLYFELGRRGEGAAHIERALELDSDILGAGDLRTVVRDYRAETDSP